MAPKASSLDQIIACCSATRCVQCSKNLAVNLKPNKENRHLASAARDRGFAVLKKGKYICTYPKNSCLLNSLTLIVLNEVFKEGFLLRY